MRIAKETLKAIGFGSLLIANQDIRNATKILLFKSYYGCSFSTVYQLGLPIPFYNLSF
jgi:hypothetical protein